MIGKTISTFDNVLPVEDTDHLYNVLNECRRRPDASDAVDLSPIVGMLVSLQNQIADLQRRYQDTCQNSDPRTPEQIDADEHAAEWRETYQSLLP